MRVGHRIDELGVLVTENGQLYFRRDSGGRWMLELRGTSTIPAGTRVHLIGTYVAPRVVAVQELATSA
jgi:hypothetical protein